MSLAGLRRPAGQRTAWAPFLLLSLTDLAAVGTLARCFRGPGELAIAVPACLLVHLVLGGGRRLTTRSPRRSLLVVGLLALAGLAGLLLPLAVLDGGSFSYGLPLGATWHLVHGQLAAALVIFSNKVAPVAEAPGLVLVTGWAAGSVALASEILYADSGLPSILSLVPAFDVVVFTGTLGTSSFRAVEVASVAALALCFLALSQADRRQERRVVMARAETGSMKPSGWNGRGLFLPGLAALAAVAAGVVGPLIPGSGSAPLVAWHGNATLAGRGGSGGGYIGPKKNQPANTIVVSDLVEVAEQEVSNPDGLLFTVHSAIRTREVLTTLDRFNGVSWSAGKTGPSDLPLYDGALPPPGRLALRPPKPVLKADGSQQVTQVIEIAALGGSELPTPGFTTAVSGQGQVTEPTRDGPLEAPSRLGPGLTYALSAELPPTSGSVIESESPFGLQPRSGPAGDLALPRPLPHRLVALAHRIVGHPKSEFSSAMALQDYFLAGHGFTYHLPSITPRGTIANTSQSYRALDDFLFSKKVGYCQQYATAFAVLGRLVGLPTRIALGFLPGKETGPHTYEVTGQQVHAWPQVWFPHYGWVSFDPTPGASSPHPPSKKGGSGGTVPTTTAPVAPHTTAPPAHNLRQLPKTGPTPSSKPARLLPASRVGQSGLSYLLYAIGLLLLAWALLVPALRLATRRRLRRDPKRAMWGAWQLATAALAAASVHRRRTETHLEFAERVRRIGLLGDGADRALFSLAGRMDQSLYGRPLPPERRIEEGAAAWREAAIVRRSARKKVGRLQLLLAAFDPRDLRSA